MNYGVETGSSFVSSAPSSKPGARSTKKTHRNSYHCAGERILSTNVLCE